MSSVTGISETISTLRKAVSPKRATAICKKLADIGADTARTKFSSAKYDGDNDVTVSVESIENGSAIIASGESALFIEFGSGLIGGGHEQAQALGFGPGTWSEGPQGKGHWDDPKGWHLPREKGGGRSYGNPPALAMYEAGVTVKENIARAIKEEYRGV